MTPASGSGPYLAPAEFLNRYDRRLVGELMRDDGTEATASELASDPNLAAILASASGEVEAATLIGGRYKVADLAALTGNSRQFLKQLVADLAIGLCRQRRGFSDEQMPLPQVEQARKTLKALGDGSLIFGFVEVIEAGVVENQYFTQADLNRQNLITGWLGDRFLGRRMNRDPRPR